MSASLVGSEMCIRDRRTSAHIGAQAHTRTSARAHACYQARWDRQEHWHGRAHACYQALWERQEHWHGRARAQ
eukprot:12077271-Alexandrium_andersonii.AAC.1